MPSFAEVREGLAASLGAISNLQASAYMLANPTLPAAEVLPGEIDYDKTFRRGMDGLEFTVRLMVGAASDIGAQKKLDAFLAPSGASSVKAALEADPTLGGDIEDLHVTKCTGYRLFPRDGHGPALGAEWTVRVWAEGAS